MSNNFSGDYFVAKQKVGEGTDYRDTTNVSFGNGSFEFAHRLLHEKELTEVRKHISFAEIAEYQEHEQSESHERLQELQATDDLTDEEERELAELTREVSQEVGSIRDALGDDAYDMIMWAGKQAIMPSQADCEDFVRELDPTEQQQILGTEEPPSALRADSERVEQALKEDIVETVTEQPFPIKMNVGMQAMMETMRVLGNGIDPEDTSD